MVQAAAARTTGQKRRRSVFELNAQITHRSRWRSARRSRRRRFHSPNIQRKNRRKKKQQINRNQRRQAHPDHGARSAPFGWILEIRSKFHRGGRPGERVSRFSTFPHREAAESKVVPSLLVPVIAVGLLQKTVAHTTPNESTATRKRALSGASRRKEAWNFSSGCVTASSPRPSEKISTVGVAADAGGFAGAATGTGAGGIEEGKERDLPWRRQFLQLRRDGDGGRNVRAFRQLKGARVGRSLGLRSERGIFRVEPVQKRPRFVRSRRDHTYLRRRRQEWNRRRVDHLEEIEAERMQRGGGEQNSGDCDFLRRGTFPSEEQIAWGLRVALAVIAVGWWRERRKVIPRSSAALVTAITRSEETRPIGLDNNRAGPRAWSRRAPGRADRAVPFDPAGNRRVRVAVMLMISLFGWGPRVKREERRNPSPRYRLQRSSSSGGKKR